MDNIELYIFGTIAILLFIVSISGLINAVQSDRDYKDNKRTFSWIWPVTLFGIVAGALFGVFYFYIGNGYYMYILLGFACLSFGFSISSLCTAIMSKREP
jgi:hypothetical protein